MALSQKHELLCFRYRDKSWNGDTLFATLHFNNAVFSSLNSVLVCPSTSLGTGSLGSGSNKVSPGWVCTGHSVYVIAISWITMFLVSLESAFNFLPSPGILKSSFNPALFFHLYFLCLQLWLSKTLELYHLSWPGILEIHFPWKTMEFAFLCPPHCWLVVGPQQPCTSPLIGKRHGAAGVLQPISSGGRHSKKSKNKGMLCTSAMVNSYVFHFICGKNVGFLEVVGFFSTQN